MTQLRRFSVLVAVFTLIAAATVPAVAQGPLDALTQDAQWYAADQRISLDEAIHRLQLQGPAGELGVQLETKERDIFAGLWIQHQPRFRIVVQLTRGGLDAILPYIKGGPLADIVEVRSAQVTYAQLQSDQEAGLSAIRAAGVRVDSSIDIIDNRVVMHVIDHAQLDAALQTANRRIPDTVKVITVAALSRPTADIYGGLALSNGCTSGFSVASGRGNGIITAAHCSDTQAYQNKNLPFQIQYNFDYYDVQLHTTPDFTLRYQIWDGSSIRAIRRTTHYNNMQIGNTVCKYGRTTGKTCGYVKAKNIAPGYIWSADPTFVQVHSSSNANLCDPGDSGGPVFYSEDAWGITSGEMGAGYVDCVFMAISFMQDNLNIYVLTQ
jgi:hypothetical protein